MIVNITGAAGAEPPLTDDNYSGNLVNGKGARVEATIPVTAGTILYIFVGGQGQNNNFVPTQNGGWNGGGSTGGSDPCGTGGGGGASDIRIGGLSLTNRIIVAGGGGGCAGSDYYCFSRGGDGGLRGTDASPSCYNFPPVGYGGLGGNSTAGGLGGSDGFYNGSPGRIGFGGDGLNGICTAPGGGGGFYGGRCNGVVFHLNRLLTFPISLRWWWC